MWADELYKFLDGTLKLVGDKLHHRILNFPLGYNKEMSRRKWSAIDKRRSELMVELIDKHMRERRIIRNLERLETKAEKVSDMEIKSLWGNLNSMAIVINLSDKIRGLLCVWDPNSFQKDNHIISDNFIALFECIVLGDFNEVRRKEERWGSTFNVYGARDFNHFIMSAGLVEVQLESSVPDIHLSDHRIEYPFSESLNTDYGAYPVSFVSLYQLGANDDLLSVRSELLKQINLGDVLKSFGFGVKWCSWIRGILNSSMASILVNGSPTKEFQFHRGLKQGDSLPLLLLCNHDLTLILALAFSKQAILQVSPISLSYLLEALEILDHLLFFCHLAKDIASVLFVIGGAWFGTLLIRIDLGYLGLIWFSFNQVQNRCWKECFTLPGGVSGHIETISSSLIQIFEKMVFLKT
ncbi:hypothetical protein Tco_0271048 [Tanacetum coccineum]